MSTGWAAYTKTRLLGSGAFGDVYHCRHNATEHPVAIKTVPVTPEKISSAINEVGILKNLHHHNVICYHDYFMDDDASHLCLVMGYADGGDLQSFVHADDDARSLPEDVIWDIFRQVLAALAYLAANNVLHRDIKPANVFLTCEGVVKLGDFGVSKLLTNTITHARTFIGTPQYMSPEVCLDEPYRHASDVWSCAVVFYEVATGRLPFHASNLLAVVNGIIRGVFDEAPLLAYTPRVRSLIKAMLVTDPEARPTAASLLAVFFPAPSRPDSPPPMDAMVSAMRHSPPPDPFTQSISWDAIANRHQIPMRESIRRFAEMVVAHEHERNEDDGIVTLRLSHADAFFDLGNIPTNIRFKSLLTRVTRISGAVDVVGFLFVDVDGDAVRVESSKEWKYVLSCFKSVRSASQMNAARVIPLTVLCS